MDIEVCVLTVLCAVAWVENCRYSHSQECPIATSTLNNALGPLREDIIKCVLKSLRSCIGTIWSQKHLFVQKGGITPATRLLGNSQLGQVAQFFA